MDRQMDGQIDGWIYRWTDRQMDTQIHSLFAIFYPDLTTRVCTAQIVYLKDRYQRIFTPHPYSMLKVRLFIYLYLYLFIQLFISLSIHLSIYLLYSLYTYLTIYRTIVLYLMSFNLCSCVLNLIIVQSKSWCKMFVLKLSGIQKKYIYFLL